MKKDIISIIIPSFNQGQFIEETIESIFSQEGNFFIDCIIADGGSSDNSVEIIKKYENLINKNLYPIKCNGIEFRWWSKKDKGQTYATNEGFKIAKGEIIAFSSSDDYYEKGTFKKILDVFKSKPNTDLVYGSGYFLYEDTGKKTFFEVLPTDFNSLLSKGNSILVSSVFMKHSTLKNLGYLDVSLNYVMDYDLWLKIFMVGNTILIKDSLSIYRFHPESKAMSQKDKFAKEIKKLKKRYGGNVLNTTTIGKIRSKIKLLEFLKKEYPKIYYLLKNIFYRIASKVKYTKSFRAILNGIKFKFYSSKQIEWNLKVPKIFHVYWGGGVLPYLRFMTVYSFMKKNPDWEIILWYPKYPFSSITWKSNELKYENTYTDYFPKLMKLPIRKECVDFKDFGIENNISETHKSNFLRLILLNKYGGVWSDMDILFFKPITNLSINTKKNKNKETFICISEYGHSDGFLMSTTGSKFFKKMELISKNEFDPKEYQCIGPTMHNKYYPTIESINKFSPAVNITMDAVYTYDANHVSEVLNSTKSRFTKRSIGIHWYGGHPLIGKFLNDTNGGLTNLPNNILGNILKNEKYLKNNTNN